MKLLFPVQEITENGSPLVQAHLATCNCVGSESFAVFQVVGQNHFHIECVDCETTYCPFGVCQLPQMVRPDPVHQEDHQWYFWDQAEVDRYGPYDDEAASRAQLEMYRRWLEQQYPQTPNGT